MQKCANADVCYWLQTLDIGKVLVLGAMTLISTVNSNRSILYDLNRFVISILVVMVLLESTLRSSWSRKYLFLGWFETVNPEGDTIEAFKARFGFDPTIK